MRSLVIVTVLVVSLSATAAPIPDRAFDNLHWRMIGPFRGGRTRACAGVATQPSVFYVAQVNGGVWKTDDYGRTWQPIFDSQPTQSIGSIAIAASDPNVIYVGSGEGLLRPDLSVGNGVYKSIDAGKTWSHVGLANAQQIPKLVVDPKNPRRLFAAVLGHPYGPSAERGLYRSLDAGETWQRVLYKDENTGAYDVEIDPRDHNIVYASLWQARLGPWEDGNSYQGTGGGLFKSLDGGTTWKQLKSGLPDDAAQFDIAIAPSKPTRLYVTLSTTEEGEYQTAKGNGLYRSDDAGATWRQATTDERPLMRIGGGDLMVPVVDPRDPDVVYVASIVAMKSRDGGKTWTWLRGAPGGDDYQNLWINPLDPNTIALVSDQGAVVTVNGGKTWSSWYNQPTAQLYHVAVTADFPYYVCSGQQESGSACVASRGLDGTIGYREWHPAGIIEYGYAAPDPANPDIVYGAGRNHVSRYSRSTHQVRDVSPIPLRGTFRVERTQPIMFSPIRRNVLYYAANVLFQSTNGGETWNTISPDLAHPNPGVPPTLRGFETSTKMGSSQRGAIYALAASYKSIATIWAGTDDGKLWVTGDGGAHWRDITPAPVTPWSKFTQLDASRFDDSTLYASVSRLRLDDLAPYVYRTHDRGNTWTLITAGLPAGPVNAVRADPVRKGLLYAATETSVFVSFDDGDQWQSLQRNLPRTSVRDIAVHGTDLIAATHGRGFWILDDISPLRHTAESMATGLLPPAPAYRWPRSEYPDTPVPPDEPTAANPPTGAILDYYLVQHASEVRLDIVDARGRRVRSYASTDPPELSETELAHQLIPSYWVAPRRQLDTSPGMHRWVWDLRRPRPQAASYDYPISAAPHATPATPQGARVAPGIYTARLTVDGAVSSQRVEVKLDPRIKLSPSQITAQNELETRLAELVDRGATALLQARSVLEQLGKLTPSDAALKAQIAAVSTKLSALVSGEKPSASGKPATESPALAAACGKLTSLYEMVAVDAAPTAVQLVSVTTAERQLAALLAAYASIRGNDLSRLGSALTAAKLPAIDFALKPSMALGHENEE